MRGGTVYSQKMNEIITVDSLGAANGVNNKDLVKRKPKTVKEILKQRLPIFSWLPHYNFYLLAQDLLAGFSVALTEIPQGIAYAGVAGLPTQYGLYAGFLDGFWYLIFGSCKDVNIGPTSILSLMVQPYGTRFGPDFVILITFLSGVIIFILGVLHLGVVVDFFGYPVIAGFISAGALNTAFSQLKSLLGVSGKSEGFIGAVTAVIENINQVRQWDAILGVCTIIFLTTLRTIKTYGSLQHVDNWSKTRNYFAKFIFMLSLSRNALAVLIGTLLATNLRDEKGGLLFKITGHVEEGLPHFQPPPFSATQNGTDYNFIDMVSEYGATVIFLPLISILEAVAIAKAFSKGRKLDATQEMIALGICNIMGSFVRSMPVTGSLTRTTVNNASGVQTTTAGAITSILVLLALQFLTSSFYYIPKASLAAVVICSMFYLFEYEAFPLIWRAKKIEMIPFLLTLLCGIFISLEYGILIGIAVNLLFTLYESARPKLQPIRVKGGVYLLRPKSSIQYPAAEYLRDVIIELDGKNTTIVIDGKYISNMEITVAKVLAALSAELKLKEQKLVFINFKDKIKKTCLAVNKGLVQNFKDCSLEDILRDDPAEDSLVVRF